MDEEPKKDEDGDIIDEQLFGIVDDLLGENPSDEEVDQASDVIFDVVGGLIDSKEIEDIPDEDESESVKKKWIKESIGKIRKQIEELNDNADTDSSD